MLNWLDHFWNRLTGTVGNAVSSAVHWAEHAIAATFLAIFGLVGKAWAELVAATQSFHKYLNAFGFAVINFANYVIRHVIPTVLRWASAELAKLSHALSSVYSWAVREFARTTAFIIDRIAFVTRWVWLLVYAPLKSGQDKLWVFLKKWGYYAWWYITHPADLADALIFHIAASLEKNAWALARLLGRFTLSLILANLSRVVALVEDIITAVL